MCVVVLPNRFQVLSNGMNEKRHSLFANMTEHSLAYDIVSGGDGVVAVSWLLACNLSFHFLFKCARFRIQARLSFKVVWH